MIEDQPPTFASIQAAIQKIQSELDIAKKEKGSNDTAELQSLLFALANTVAELGDEAKRRFLAAQESSETLAPIPPAVIEPIPVVIPQIDQNAPQAAIPAIPPIAQVQAREAPRATQEAPAGEIKDTSSDARISAIILTLNGVLSTIDSQQEQINALIQKVNESKIVESGVLA